MAIHNKESKWIRYFIRIQVKKRDVYENHSKQSEHVNREKQ